MKSNKQSSSNQEQRHYITSVNSLTSNTIHFRNPWIIAWWSAAFPGFGHFMTNSHIMGLVLMSVEYLLNSHIQLNLAIFYSFIGEFEQAKETINMTYLSAYASLYVFAIWDSYRRPVEINKVFQLAYKETTKIQPFHITAMEVNVLEKKEPWVAFAWSLIMPGLGQMYLHRLPTIFLVGGCSLLL